MRTEERVREGKAKMVEATRASSKESRRGQAQRERDGDQKAKHEILVTEKQGGRCEKRRGEAGKVREQAGGEALTT